MKEEFFFKLFSDSMDVGEVECVLCVVIEWVCYGEVFEYDYYMGLIYLFVLDEV